MTRTLPANPLPRVLVVEDEEATRRCLCHLLEGFGYACAGASNGLQALELARTFRPQVIIMDLMMPVLDGYEATRRLKADAATRTIPVLALTASATPTDRKQANQAGIDEFLTKPTDLDQLLGQLQRHGAHAAAGS
jgi:CheY-like chemotaxis protein